MTTAACYMVRKFDLLIPSKYGMLSFNLIFATRHYKIEFWMTLTSLLLCYLNCVSLLAVRRWYKSHISFISHPEYECLYDTYCSNTIYNV